MKGKNEKIKIALVIESLSTGGRERMVIDIANNLPESDYDINVILLSNDKTEQRELVAKNVIVHCLPFKYNQLGGLSAIYFWFRGFFLLIKTFRKVKPDIVHTHLFFQQLLFVCTALKFSKLKSKHFHTVHTAGLFFSGKGIINSFRLLIEKLSVRFSHSYIIAISDIVYKQCQTNFSKESAMIKCIYNGVDDTKFDYRLREKVSRREYNYNNDDILVTYVARMDEGKNHATLLKAWKKINDQFPNSKLLLVGGGVLEGTLKSYARENHLYNSVNFLGNIVSVNFVLAITDIGAFPSLFEGFSIALLEKMFMKIPVVASDIPANSSLITNGFSGFLFETKSEDELAESLIKLIKSKDLRIQMGNNAYSIAKQYNLQSMISNHEKYYNSALEYEGIQ